MVRILETSFSIAHPWHKVSLACFFKYPNPFSKHVLSSDIISRRIDPATGNLHTTKLLHKTSSLPSWLRSLCNNASNGGGYVLEESEVDFQHRTMSIKTTNVSHARIVQVTESILLEEAQGAASAETIVRGTTKVVSHFGWGAAVKAKVEAYLTKRLKEHFETKSGKALQFVVERMLEANGSFLR